MKDRNKRRLIIYGLLGVLMLTTVAYAALQTVLNVSGTVVKKGNLWNIYFTNPSSASTVGSATGSKINIQASTLNFQVSLYKPGDKVTYTVDIKNGGTIDATLNSISLTGVDTAKSNNINYTVTYSDGSIIKQGDILNIGTSKTIKIIVEFDSTATSIAASDINLSFGVTLIYNQTSGSSSSSNSGITSNNVIAGIYGNSIQNGTPTPTSPVEIESVGEKTKNLFSITDNNIEVTYGNVTLSINNNIITLNGTATSNFQFGLYLENGKLKSKSGIIDIENNTPSILNLKNGTYTQSLKYISGTISGDSSSYYAGFYTYKNATRLVDTRQAMGDKDVSKTFTISNNNDVQFFVIQITASKSQVTFNNYKFKYQLEEGSTSTSYEPYGYKIPITVSNGTTSNTTNIYLKEPLRKVGDTADYLDLENKKVVRNIKEIVFNGTEQWLKHNNLNNYYINDDSIVNVNIKMYKKGKITMHKKRNKVCSY